MTRAKELLLLIYIERDFFNGNEARAHAAAEEDAEDFAEYEAAVEALERLANSAAYYSMYVAPFSQSAGAPDLAQAVRDADVVLRRLKEGVTA